MLARLARFSYRKRWVMVFAIWLPIMIGISAIGGAVGDYHTSFSLPDSESKEVVDILAASGQSNRGGNTAQIVFTAPQGTDDPEIKTAMEGLFAQVAEIEGLAVTSPFSPEGAQFNSTTKPISFAQISYDVKGQSEAIEIADQIKALGDEVQIDGLRIEYGGQLFAGFEFPPSEILGFLAAVIILLIAFGSVLAMGLPLGTAVFGLFTGIGLVGVASKNASLTRDSGKRASSAARGSAPSASRLSVMAGFLPAERTARWSARRGPTRARDRASG